MKYLKLVIALIVVSLLVVVCGGQTTPARAEEPKQGGTLTYVLSSDIVSFDPHATRELVSGVVNAQMFDYLTRLDENGQAQPSLAESWEISEDNLTWTFHLVQGVKFHDGTPFNAEAVKKNLDRILHPDSVLPSKRLIAGIEVKVVDESTFQIVTENPFGPLPQNLSHYSLGMISPAALDQYDDQELAQNPVGTGPFKFVSYKPAESIVLERNEDYWGQVSYVDQVTFKPVPEPATRVVMLETGEADIVTKIPAVEVERLNGVEGVTVNVVPFNRVFYVMMHNQRAPLDDPKVRQALNYAVDKQAIADNVFQGLVSVATGPISSKVFGYAETPRYEYDPEKAKALLAEAGYPDGFTLKFFVPQGRYLGGEESSTAIQAYLAAVGVQAEIEVLEWAAYLDEIDKPPEEAQYNLAFIGFSPSTNDADWMLYTHYHCDSMAPASNNSTFTCDPELDELLDAGRFTVDPEERQAIYAQVLDKIVSEARDIYLFEEAQITGVGDNVHGLVYLPVELFHLEEVWTD